MVARRSPPDDIFIAEYRTIGARNMARKYDIGERAIHQRRKRLERELNMPIVAGTAQVQQARGINPKNKVEWEIDDGIVLVGSDAHYWPNEISTAHLAFVDLCKRLKPQGVVMNGDLVDGARISRHPVSRFPMNWEKLPQVDEELETVKLRLSEIEKAAKGAWKAWTLGNHDMRFEARLANLAPEYAGVHGVHLHDHFGAQWSHCWSVWVNANTVIKHRWKGGIHARHNNTVASGVNFVSGHLHSLGVTPYSDYTGTRYGVDTGTLAEPYGPQFQYTEDNPVNWRSGGAVLTWENGRLLWPEVFHVVDRGVYEFRGKTYEVNVGD